MAEPLFCFGTLLVPNRVDCRRFFGLDPQIQLLPKSDPPPPNPANPVYQPLHADLDV